jgi:hypothetical protein
MALGCLYGTLAVPSKLTSWPCWSGRRAVPIAVMIGGGGGGGICCVLLAYPGEIAIRGFTCCGVTGATGGGIGGVLFRRRSKFA